jgi:hypothetical protein
MSENPLAFLQMIAAAMEPDSDPGALREALLKLRRRLSQTSNALAAEQFVRWMHLVEDVASAEESVSSVLQVAHFLLSGAAGEINGHLVHEHVDFAPITPGRYVLTHVTGRVLWTGVLTRRELLWSEAFPGQFVPAAAATDHTDPPPASLTEVLCGGGLSVRVVPGLVHGTIELRHRLEERG